ncbi:hypothetical protein D0469_14635 [Peribacillus saganii]|uniref:Uncharacterized protein n=1 Tax=Peribacillus saganii TaxID=2303992 RepID=A0A372LL23_9BACI|nr:hypothetical protein [Peribacillus saganii]RFU67485.1 hypothetical protein D0469_14635 [Peribacillus saganii]
MFNDYEMQIIVQSKMQEFEGFIREQSFQNQSYKPIKNPIRNLIFKKETVQPDCCQAACCTA